MLFLSSKLIRTDIRFNSFNFIEFGPIHFNIRRIKFFFNHFIEMGSWFSKNEEIKKTVESTGQVNNNVIVEDSVTIHNTEIIILLYIIAIVKAIEFIVFLYNAHTKRLKRKYGQNLPGN